MAGCHTCKTDPLPGLKTCARCQARARIWREKRLSSGQCGKCTAPPEPGRTLCRSCADAANHAGKARSAAGWCRSCTNRVEPGKQYCRMCLDNRKVYRDQYRLDLRSEAFIRYGGPTCRCCGESRWEFLTVDHVNNDGARHIPAGAKYRLSGSRLYGWLKTNGYPEGFQVLCYNCNCAKGAFGQCPHEKERAPVGE